MESRQLFHLENMYSRSCAVIEGTLSDLIFVKPNYTICIRKWILLKPTICSMLGWLRDRPCLIASLVDYYLAMQSLWIQIVSGFPLAIMPLIVLTISTLLAFAIYRSALHAPRARTK